MSDAARAGRLGCVCEPGEARAAPPAGPWALGALSAGFGLAVLAQVLATALLPLAAIQIGATGWLRAAPFAAMLAGTAVATLPASLLVDGLGRRAALALGAALGIAGGGLLIIAVETSQLAVLVLGAFWLGIAQGFGLFHRHLAAAGGGGRVGLVIGAGVGGGLFGPAVLMAAEAATAPFTFRGAALAIVAVEILALLAAMAQPTRALFGTMGDLEAEPATDRSRSALLPATTMGALAWGAMAAAMAGGPLTLLGCGLSGAETTSAVAWHAIAMYLPALALPLLVKLAAPPRIAEAGLVFAALSLLAWGVFGGPQAAQAALIGAGAGWSLTISGVTAWLGAERPSRGALAAHDAVLVGGAVAGALLGAVVA